MKHPNVGIKCNRIYTSSNSWMIKVLLIDTGYQVGYFSSHTDLVINFKPGTC